MARPVSTVDRLPEAERKKVIDRILGGESLASVAATLGISRQAMSRYKRDSILPAIKTATKIHAVTHARGDSPVTTAQHVAESKALTKEVLRASPVADRVQQLWDQTQMGISAANVGNDLTALAQLINQGHKSVELLGKLTGEFTPDQTIGTGLTIQIVMPTALASVRTEAYHGPVIDVQPTEDNGDEYVIALPPR